MSVQGMRFHRLPPSVQDRIRDVWRDDADYLPESCPRCEENGNFHLMIDIETLGLTPGAPVLAIGLAAFCPHTGGVLKTEYLDIAPAQAREIADFVDPETEQWWQEQPQEARDLAFGGKMTPREALDKLCEFASEYENPKAWGNGSTFDISILEAWIARVDPGRRVPWAFWDIRDVRTAREMVPSVTDRDLFDRNGAIKHFAIDDALLQVRMVSAAYMAADALGEMTELLFRTDQEPLLQEYERDRAVTLAELSERRAHIELWMAQKIIKDQEEQIEELKALVSQAREDYLERHSDGIHDCVTPYDRHQHP